MSLPTTAPALHASSSTDARQVSHEMATSKRSRRAAMGPTTRSSSSDSPTSVEEVGTLVDQHLGAVEQRVELEGEAPVVERVGRAVEDAHHQRAGREVEDLFTQAVAELGDPVSRHGRGAYAGGVRPPAG